MTPSSNPVCLTWLPPKSTWPRAPSWPAGFTTTIFVAPGTNRDPVIAIQAMLAEIGITANLQFPEPAAWQSITTQPAQVNSLIYIPFAEFSNFNTSLNVFFSGRGFYLPSNQKPDGYVDLFNASLAAPARIR